jgi:hypothetical protein
MNIAINTFHFLIPLREIGSYTYQIAKTFEKPARPMGAST